MPVLTVVGLAERRSSEDAVGGRSFFGLSREHKLQKFILMEGELLEIQLENIVNRSPHP